MKTKLPKHKVNPELRKIRGSWIYNATKELSAEFGLSKPKRFIRDLEKQRAK